jgi:hypothetical protein
MYSTTPVHCTVRIQEVIYILHVPGESVGEGTSTTTYRSSFLWHRQENYAKVKVLTTLWAFINGGPARNPWVVWRVPNFLCIKKYLAVDNDSTKRCVRKMLTFLSFGSGWTDAGGDGAFAARVHILRGSGRNFGCDAFAAVNWPLIRWVM